MRIFQGCSANAGGTTFSAVMSDENALIQAILDAPADPTPRLIYADWLEEQGSPRAELFRIQHALTQSVDAPDRAALEARQQQLLDAGAAPATVVWRNRWGTEFALIPLGEFRMGSPPGEFGRFANEQPRRVTITRPFLMSIYAVTQQHYQDVCGTQPSYFPRRTRGTQGAKRAQGRLPVESVAWDDAVAFCDKLNELERLRPDDWDTHPPEPAAPFLAGESPGNGREGGYRLPTEAEWEYACRAGTTTPWAYAGDVSRLPQFAHFGKTRTQAVGRLHPNAFGLYDMHGNVWEWCRDFWGEYDPQATVDPQGPRHGNVHVIRGGSYASTSLVTRSASRDLNRHQSRDTGFRICRSL